MFKHLILGLVLTLTGCVVADFDEKPMAATTEQALEPSPEPIGMLFSSVMATGTFLPIS
jgi:hypothetical protein